MFKRLIASLVCLTFSFSNLQYVHAQASPATGGDFSVNQLPVPGTMIGESTPFAPLALKGLIVNPQKPLEFQFIVDTGKGPQDTASVKEQANQLVKYFLAGLTIPEGDLWVNLSPYEKDRMVPEALGQTDLGRDLLAQDYILKQLTASLIYPEKDLGKEFWSRVYAKAQKQFGTTNIPVNTFNKVWILPDQAQVYENVNAAYITKSTLKVMLDEDYLAKQKHQATQASSVSSQVVRQIILPEIEKEVNAGKNFAPLRQIYQALILAKWYKETIQNGLLDAVYTNKNKIAGVNLNDPSVKEQIYERYLKAYKKGAFNYIKEDPTPDGQIVPRKYFSGGILPMKIDVTRTKNPAMIGQLDGAMVAVKVNLEESKDTAKLTYEKFIDLMTAYGGGGFWLEKTDYKKRGYKFVPKKENVYDKDGKFIRKAEKPEWVDDDGNALTQKIVINFLNRTWKRLIKDECIVNGKVQMGVLQGHLFSSDFFGLNTEKKTKFYNLLGGYYGILQRRKQKESDKAMRSDLDAELLEASSNEKKDLVELLLKKGANVNARDGNDNTPLMFAAEDGHPNIVNLLLLEKDVNINAKNKEGQTPLALAVLNGHEDVVKRLLLEKEVDVNAKLNWKWGETTILMMAVAKGNKDIVELLLKKGADINAKDRDGNTALFWAKGYKHQDIVEILTAEILKAAGETGQSKQDYFTLVNLLKDENYYVLIDTIGRLVQLDDKRAVVPLLERLHDEKLLNGHDREIRLLIIAALGQLGGEGVITPLLDELQRSGKGKGYISYNAVSDSREEKQRGQVIKIPPQQIQDLVVTPQKKFSIFIETMLSNEDGIIRKAAMGALDKLVVDPQKRVLIFEEASKNKYPEVRLWARQGFGHKVETDIGKETVQTSMDWLVDRKEYTNTKLKALRESSKDEAALAEKGGIDLNQINVLRKGKTVNVQFDPAQLNELMQGGFEGFTPVIVNITHISSPFQLLGINPAK